MRYHVNKFARKIFVAITLTKPYVFISSYSILNIISYRAKKHAGFCRVLMSHDKNFCDVITKIKAKKFLLPPKSLNITHGYIIKSCFYFNPKDIS